jgi:aspartate ammonia-lyase
MTIDINVRTYTHTRVLHGEPNTYMDSNICDSLIAQNDKCSNYTYLTGIVISIVLKMMKIAHSLLLQLLLSL